MVYFGCDSMSLTTTLKVQGHNDLIKAHAMKEATFIRSRPVVLGLSFIRFELHCALEKDSNILCFFGFNIGNAPK